MNPFELKAQPKAENILANYGYCLVTPLSEDYGPQIPIQCTDIDEIRDLYNDNYDVWIETPDGCSL